MYAAATTSHKVFSIDLSTNMVKLFASRDTLDALATGAAASDTFTNPDNLAIDARRMVYRRRPAGRAGGTSGSPWTGTATALAEAYHQ